MTAAAGNDPSVIAGRMMLVAPDRPPVGKKSKFTARKRISIRPSQKLGTACPSSAKTRAITSTRAAAAHRGEDAQGDAHGEGEAERRDAQQDRWRRCAL